MNLLLRAQPPNKVPFFKQQKLHKRRCTDATLAASVPPHRISAMPRPVVKERENKY